MSQLAQRLEMPRGDTRDIVIPTTENISTATQLIFTAKTSFTRPDGQATAQKTLTSGGIAAGTTSVTVSLLTADTAGLVGRVTLFWDVQAQWASGAVRSVAAGTLLVKPDATQTLLPAVEIYTLDPEVPSDALLSANAAAASAAAAALSEANAADSAEAASTDASQVADDAAQVALDRIATAADAVSTAEDAIATTADRVATAADAISTAADAATASQAADDAGTAKDAAEAAETASEAARDLTFGYRDEVEVFKETVEQDAATAISNAQTAVAAAATATTKAGEASDSADAAETARDVTLGYRDTAETHKNAAAVSATEALASQVAAAGSAASASASAATALAALIDLYVSAVAGNAVPSTASAAGRYYRVLSAGTTASLLDQNGDAMGAVGKGDILIYTGTVWRYVKIAMDTYGFAVESTTNAALAARAHRDRYISPGVETNRRIELASGAHQNVAGTAGTLRVQPFTVPTSGPSVSAFLFAVQDSIASPTSLGNAMSGRLVATTADLVIRAAGATSGDIREFTYPGFRAAYSGQPVQIVVRFPEGNSTTDPVIYANGVDITASFTLSTAGDAPPWMPPELATTYFLSAYNWPTSADAPIAEWCTYDIGATAALALSGTGRWPAAAALGGSVVALYSFDGTATDSFTIDSLAGFDVNTTVAGKAYMLLPASGTGRMQRVLATLAVGRKYRVSVKVRLNSGSSTPLRFGTSTANAAAYVEFSGFTGTEATFTGVFTADGTTIRFGALSSNGSAYEVDDIAISEVGLLDSPQVQRGLATRDGLNRFSRRVVGFTAETDRADWVINTTTATSGNEQLLGGAVLGEANRNRIDSWVVNNRGTSKTVSLGNASAGTQYANGITAAAGPTDVTLAARIAAATSLWAASNGTDVLSHTITGHNIGA